jgi:hypothetical protein
MSDSYRSLFRLKQNQTFSVHDKVSSERLFANSWFLLHQAGTYTNAHQDVAGEDTVVSIPEIQGTPTPKIWGIMHFKDPAFSSSGREKIRDVISKVCS